MCLPQDMETLPRDVETLKEESRVGAGGTEGPAAAPCSKADPEISRSALKQSSDLQSVVAIVSLPTPKSLSNSSV